MIVFKCKMCGGELNIVEGSTVCECEYCGSKQTIPSLDNEKKTNLFNRANRLRFNNEFDKASGIYETIVSEFPEEAEAYWGLLLCKYGIEYVDDPLTSKKIPTCHRANYTSIFDDENFELCLEYSDSLSKEVYRSEAKEIDRIQESILDVASKEEPFDVFICYKETDENGNRTKDSVLAQDIYDKLTEKGYKVFFSRITLEDKLGQEYEPYIFSALNSAKVMLAIGTKYDYYDSVWVKNEWSRFLDLMKSNKDKVLIPCYADIDAYDLPKEFKNLQGQDMNKLGFIQDLIRGVENHYDSIFSFENNEYTYIKNLVEDRKYEKILNIIENERNITNAYAKSLISYICKDRFDITTDITKFEDIDCIQDVSKLLNYCIDYDKKIDIYNNALELIKLKNRKGYELLKTLGDFKDCNDILKEYKNKKNKHYVLSFLLLCLILLMYLVIDTYNSNLLKTEESSNDINSYEIGTNVYFGHLEQDGDFTNGEEPIRWVVIENNGDSIVMLSNDILEFNKYDDNSKTTTWEDSYIFHHLNEEFADTIFSDEEKEMLINSGNAGKISMLSEAQFAQLDEKYKYAKPIPIICKDANFINKSTGCSDWILKDLKTHSMEFKTSNGTIATSYSYVPQYVNTLNATLVEGTIWEVYGIRPVICVRIR